MKIHVRDITIDNSVFAEATTIGMKNGAYPRTLRSKGLPKLNEKRYFLLYAAPVVGQYATMAKASKPDFMDTINGGIATDTDYPNVGTFGVYRIDGDTPNLEFWADFDHWPIEGKNEQGIPVLKNGLANGHYHDTPALGRALPVTSDIYSLYLTVVSMAR